MKCKFPSRFNDKSCLSPCIDGQDREQHIFLCKYFSNQNKLSFPNIKFDQIFENNVRKQTDIVYILYARLEVRKQFLPSASPAGVPHDPRGARAQTKPRLGIREAKHKFTKLKHKNKTRCIIR